MRRGKIVTALIDMGTHPKSIEGRECAEWGKRKVSIRTKRDSRSGGNHAGGSKAKVRSSYLTSGRGEPIDEKTE